MTGVNSVDLTKRCESKQNRRKIYFFVNNFVSDMQPTSCVIILELFLEKLFLSTQPQEIQMIPPRRQLVWQKKHRSVTKKEIPSTFSLLLSSSSLLIPIHLVSCQIYLFSCIFLLSSFNIELI